jgi:hypothetical protein
VRGKTPLRILEKKSDVLLLSCKDIILPAGLRMGHREVNSSSRDQLGDVGIMQMRPWRWPIVEVVRSH